MSLVMLRGWLGCARASTYTSVHVCIGSYPTQPNPTTTTTGMYKQHPRTASAREPGAPGRGWLPLLLPAEGGGFLRRYCRGPRASKNCEGVCFGGGDGGLVCVVLCCVVCLWYMDCGGKAALA